MTSILDWISKAKIHRKSKKPAALKRASSHQKFKAQCAARREQRKAP